MTPADPDIAEFLARGGTITRCPTAAAVATSARPPAEDRRQVREHEDQQEAKREERRRHSLSVIDPAGLARWIAKQNHEGGRA
jgi:ribosomal protein L12E/L44/L45/RPP1/RPP2